MATKLQVLPHPTVDPWPVLWESFERSFERTVHLAHTEDVPRGRPMPTSRSEAYRLIQSQSRNGTSSRG